MAYYKHSYATGRDSPVSEPAMREALGQMHEDVDLAQHNIDVGYPEQGKWWIFYSN